MSEHWKTENLAEAEGMEHPEVGKAFLFGESRPGECYRDVGVNIRVLAPGQPAARLSRRAHGGVLHRPRR